MAIFVPNGPLWTAWRTRWSLTRRSERISTGSWTQPVSRRSSGGDVLALPGLVVWRHLPRLLDRVRHEWSRPFDIDPDLAFVETVRAGQSLLAWVAIQIGPIDGKVISRLRDMTVTAVDEARKLKRPPPSGPPLPHIVAGWVVPHLWKVILFADGKSAETREKPGLVELCSGNAFSSHKRIGRSYFVEAESRGSGQGVGCGGREPCRCGQGP